MLHRRCFSATALRAVRPVRSVLYLPGSNARALVKALGSDEHPHGTLQPAPDALILDLEDAVAPAAKNEARVAVRDAVLALARRRELLRGSTSGFESSECTVARGPLVTVRVNALDTPWGGDDMDMAAALGPTCAALVLPKVGSAATVLSAVGAMERGGAHGAMELWPMLETAGGVLHAAAIGAAHSRVGALVMGTSDLAKVRTRAPCRR